MKFDSYKAAIWGTGLWIYVLMILVVIEIDVSPLFIALTFIPVLALYLFMLNRENKALSKKDLAARKPRGLLKLRQRDMTMRDLAESFIAVFGAVILGVLTGAFVIRPEIGLQITDSIRISGITCERDASKIVTLPVNKTITAADATITVHAVRYNVPQESEHPIEFGDDYHCAKATLVDVTVDRPQPAQDGATRSVSLQAGKDERVTPRYYGLDDYEDYIAKENLAVLNGQDFTHKDDTYRERGWWLFRLPQDYSNNDNTLVYSERTNGSMDTKKMSIELPSPGESKN